MYVDSYSKYEKTSNLEMLSIFIWPKKQHTIEENGGMICL